MQPLAISETGFDRMTERVSEIEQGSLASLPFIGRDDFRLVGTGPVDGMDECILFAREAAPGCFPANRGMADPESVRI